MSSPILIIGGGIGGMTAALALLRAGFKVEIHEQAPKIGDVGAGITLGKTASRGLYSLGLQDAIIEMADIPKRSGALHYQTGEVIAAAPSGAPGAGGPGGSRMLDQGGGKEPPWFHQLHRADLFTILMDAVNELDPTALRLNRSFVRHEQDDDGVTAFFADGSQARGSILIGCDGIRSAVRTQMFGDEDPRFTGQVVYRFLIPVDRVQQYLTDGESNLFIGPGRTVLRYLIRHGQVVNGVAFVKTDAWTGEGYSEQVTPEELLEQFPGWHEKVLGLFRNAPPEGTAKWALYDRDPLPSWTDRRVALLGDAAHPMLPFLGLGAAMGIEDAVVLARALALEPDLMKALKVYENARRERANNVLLESRAQGERFQSSLKPEAPASAAAATETLYDYDPATVALEPA